MGVLTTQKKDMFVLVRKGARYKQLERMISVFWRCLITKVCTLHTQFGCRLMEPQCSCSTCMCEPPKCTKTPVKKRKQNQVKRHEHLFINSQHDAQSAGVMTHRLKKRIFTASVPAALE